MWPFSSSSFNPKTDIPSLNGKTIIITGANSGLGLESLIQLAAHSPSKIYLCARSKVKYETAMEYVEKSVPDARKFVHFLELDLSSLQAVKQAADAFNKENDRLDVLMNNAGIMAQPPSLTPDGYEAQFGTNHMGHFLLTKLLLPTLQKTAQEPKSDVRIINLSSEGHKMAPSAGFLPEESKTPMESYVTWTRYGHSKMANILFTRELARRHPNITSVSIHPGAVATNLASPFLNNHPWVNFWLGWTMPLFFNDGATGAWGQTWASTAVVEGKESWTVGDRARRWKVVKNGVYYAPVAKEGTENKTARDEGGIVAKKLWDWSEAEVKAKGY